VVHNGAVALDMGNADSHVDTFGSLYDSTCPLCDPTASLATTQQGSRTTFSNEYDRNYERDERRIAKWPYVSLFA
jgi:hypothetical protein